jgi:hypothetical protein
MRMDTDVRYPMASSAHTITQRKIAKATYTTGQTGARYVRFHKKII